MEGKSFDVMIMERKQNKEVRDEDDEEKEKRNSAYTTHTYVCVCVYVVYKRFACKICVYVKYIHRERERGKKIQPRLRVYFSSVLIASYTDCVCVFICLCI